MLPILCMLHHFLSFSFSFQTINLCVQSNIAQVMASLFKPPIESNFSKFQTNSQKEILLVP